MAGFKKAEPKQAALKVGIYGQQGSGKTFTTLLIAEALAKHFGKRVAYVDTERGTDFYAVAVAERRVHPEAFDFDALYTRSLTETLTAVRGLSATYGVLVLDSITHLWEAAKAAYGGIPLHAWGEIKRPYKELMNLVVNSPMHVFILGRQGNDYEEDDETGELKNVGAKMKAEGETPYEPHILLRMENIRSKKGKNEQSVPTAFVEKDRTGILQGKAIAWPNFDNIARPLLGLIGGEQAHIASEDEAAAQDADALMREDRDKAKKSADTLRKFKGHLDTADSEAQVKAIGDEITPGLKRGMVTEHVNELRQHYLDALDRVRGHSTNGKSRQEETAHA
jgi:hypothetical protein